VCTADRQTVLVNQLNRYVGRSRGGRIDQSSPIVRPIEEINRMAKSGRRHCVVESDGIDNGTRVVGSLSTSKNMLTAAGLGAVTMAHFV